MDMEDTGSNVVCLYHADCFDGMGAAWTVKQHFPDATFIAVEYQQVPPHELLKGKRVYIVDFSYNFEWLNFIAIGAEELHIFDHHKSAARDLERFNAWAWAFGFDQSKFRAVFDLERSGALITFGELFPHHPVPAIIDYISDRDLWKFAYDDTKEVLATLGSYPLDLEVWSRLFPMRAQGDDFYPNHNKVVDDFADSGTPLLRKQQIEVDRVIDLTRRPFAIGEYTVEMINVPRHLVSEAVGQLSKGAPFAVGYFDTADSRVFSFRSVKGEGMDVSQVAALIGGGGHTNSAGAIVPRDHPLALI